MKIWILSDSKPGHLTQTRALARSIELLTSATTTEVTLAGLRLLGKRRKLLEEGAQGKPDLIIAAGHSTHLPLLWATHHFGAKSILCMKPSLPVSCFDLCLIPRHDLLGKTVTSRHIFPTIGALHGIRPNPNHVKDIQLILIGGPSKSYGWDAEALISQLQAVAEHSESPIILTTSRRTPADFVDQVTKACPSIQVVPVEQTKQGWVAQHLERAQSVWVTEDSVSMVYESLGSGAPVGILSMPPLPKGSTRIVEGLKLLRNENKICWWEDWKQTGALPVPEASIPESDRAAQFIVNTLLSKP
jgi:mitochondrial fission protein ELM1